MEAGLFQEGTVKAQVPRDGASMLKDAEYFCVHLQSVCLCGVSEDSREHQAKARLGRKAKAKL